MREVCAGAAAIYEAIRALVAAAGANDAMPAFADDTWMHGRVSGPMTENTPARPSHAWRALRVYTVDTCDLLRVSPEGMNCWEAGWSGSDAVVAVSWSCPSVLPTAVMSLWCRPALSPSPMARSPSCWPHRPTAAAIPSTPMGLSPRTAGS
ncbi:hypothetical protein KUTG_09743 [Kutzneria sp. 744]|nr:hypothetical protein KUTG_09743 [Kutzneria sp. 744]